MIAVKVVTEVLSLLLHPLPKKKKISPVRNSYLQKF